MADYITGIAREGLSIRTGESPALPEGSVRACMPRAAGT
jgi:hypothetical protein